MIRQICDYCGSSLDVETAASGFNASRRTLDGKHGAVTLEVNLSGSGETFASICRACEVAAVVGAVKALEERFAPKVRAPRKAAPAKKTTSKTRT